jgi:hypothetical protein
MIITSEIKTKIVAALAESRERFDGSDAKFAVSLGIAHAQYSRVKGGDTAQVLSEKVWISLARRMEVPIGNAPVWNTAQTPVYEFIMNQLTFCQQYAGSRLLCDVPDIGKTYSAHQYVKSNKNAVYVDCSQVKTKQKLVRFIAKEYGIGHTGKYSDVYADLVFYLRSLPSPLIILDEAGDLDYPAFLELKALWNATERCCGWYMMGADGLRNKIRRSIDSKKVGYAELFSRYGSKYQRATPDSLQELNKFKQVHAALIIQANCKTPVDIQKMIVKTENSLRRIADELRKVS